MALSQNMLEIAAELGGTDADYADMRSSSLSIFLIALDDASRRRQHVGRGRRLFYDVLRLPNVSATLKVRLMVGLLPMWRPFTTRTHQKVS